MIKRVFGKNFEDIINSENRAGLTGIVPELAALYAAGIKNVTRRNLIWLTGENEKTSILKSDLEAWSRFLGDKETEVHLHTLPWEDPYINNSISAEIAGEKNRLLADIKENKKIVVISTLAALSIRLERKKDYEIATPSVNDPLTPGALIKTLTQLGYHDKKKVEESGDYTYHGKIVDIFPAGFTYPFRIKFSDNTIESIKRFHPVSQISIEAVESINITTTVYFEKTRSMNTETLFLTELLENYIIVATDYDLLKDEYKKLLENFEHMRRHHRDDEAWRPVS
ncbi:MAG: hypothetical protein GY757_13050, partial [bacterium]|nr:hypothetical protein [bacterium]